MSRFWSQGVGMPKLVLSLSLLVIGACWRGGSLPPCPSGVVSTGDSGGVRRCEQAPRLVKRAGYKCQYLARLVGRLPEHLDGEKCAEFAGFPTLHPMCRADFFEERAALLMDWANRAIAMCAPP